MAARGPLPNPNRRRRNAPTIPTTNLPAAGRQEPAPECPYELAEAGARWWAWAWALPQACAWSDGDLYVVARRARLEDDIAAMAFADYFELSDLLAGESDREAVQRVEWALTLLRRSASGKLAVEKEMRELDGKLGLSPEALAKLRWTIVDEAAEKPATAPVAKASPRAHLRAVDPSLAESG